MSNEKAYWEMTIAALLHDVGKVGQRAHDRYEGLSEQSKRMESQLCPQDRSGRYHTHLHVLYTNEFFNRIESALPADLDRAAIINCSVRHHKPEPGTLSEVLARADWLASGMERTRQARTEGRSDYRETRLVSVLSQVRLPGMPKPQPAEHNLDVWDTDASVLFPASGSEDSLRKDYKHLWDTLIERCTLLKPGMPPHVYASGLMDILEAVTWCVPSATNAVPDISLFDHSRAVAAIAGVMISDGKEGHPYLLVGGDFAGIQHFMYDLHHGAGQAAKTLRARSFLVSVFSDHVSLALLQRLGLSYAHRIISAGGKCIMLLSNTPDVHEEVGAISREIDAWSLETTDGELRYVLSALPLSAADLGRFGDSLAGLYAAIDDAKRRPLVAGLSGSDGWMENAFLRAPLIFTDAQDLCDSCRKRAGDHDPLSGKHLCPICSEQRRLGQKLPRALGITLDMDEKEGAFRFPLAGMDIITERRQVSEDSSAVLHWKPIGAVAEAPSIFQRRALHVPIRGEDILEFEEIAEMSTGRKALGVVKADVDFLGLVFSSGLGSSDGKNGHDVEGARRTSISRVATLSRFVEGFFGGYVQRMVEQDFPGIYIVYSGGDDLLIVGPWDKTIEFMLTLRQRFAGFVQDNPSLRISAGHVISPPKTPLVQMAAAVEGALESSKKYRRNGSGASGSMKDAVTLFGETMNWSAAQEAIKTGRDLAAWAEKEILGTAAIRRLLRYAGMFREYQRNPHDSSHLEYVTLLTYDLKRNWSDRTEDHIAAKQWAQQLLNPTFEGLPSLLTACHFALQKTRS